MHRQQVLSDGASAPEDAARDVGRRQSGEGAIPGRRASWVERQCFDSSLNMIFVNTVEVAESEIITSC